MTKMWIARDEDGSLYIYKGKPSRYNGFFDNDINYSSISLNSDLFPEVTWENSPQEIEIILKK